MNLDWVVSLFVVTLIVFGLIVVVEVEFSDTEGTYVARAATSSIAETISNQVNRVEALDANVTLNFTYTYDVNTSVVLPANLNGHPYSVDFTHDFVIVLTTSSVPVGTAINFWQPVYLFNISVVHYLANSPVNGSALKSLGANSTCMSLTSGTNFFITRERALVDGQTQYLTIISSGDFLNHGC
jgi:hypothetical protein